MNPIKKFFKDFGNLPKHEFGSKYFLLPATLTFLCFTIWLTSRILTPIDSLTRTVGTVASIDSVITRVRNKPLYKRVDKDLRIHLADEEHFFKVSGSKGFHFITSKIKIGDKIIIYADPPFESFLFGKSRRMCQLEHNGETIIDFRKEKKSYYPSVAILVVSTLAFGTWYVYRRRKASANNALAKAGLTEEQSAIVG